MDLIRFTKMSDDVLDRFTVQHTERFNNYIKEYTNEYDLEIIDMVLDEDLLFDEIELGFEIIHAKINVYDTNVIFEYRVKENKFLLPIDYNEPESTENRNIIDFYKLSLLFSECLNNYCKMFSKYSLEDNIRLIIMKLTNEVYDATCKEIKEKKGDEEMPQVVHVPTNDEYKSFEKAITTDDTRDQLIQLYRTMPKLSEQLRNSVEKGWRTVNSAILGKRILPYEVDWSNYKATDITVVEKSLPNTLLETFNYYQLNKLYTLPPLYETGLLIDIKYQAESNYVTTEVHAIELIVKDSDGRYYYSYTIM